MQMYIMQMYITMLLGYNGQKANALSNINFGLLKCVLYSDIFSTFKCVTGHAKLAWLSL